MLRSTYLVFWSCIYSSSELMGRVWCLIAMSWRGDVRSEKEEKVEEEQAFSLPPLKYLRFGKVYANAFGDLWGSAIRCCLCLILDAHWLWGGGWDILVAYWLAEDEGLASLLCTGRRLTLLRSLILRMKALNRFEDQKKFGRNILFLFFCHFQVYSAYSSLYFTMDLFSLRVYLRWVIWEFIPHLPFSSFCQRPTSCSYFSTVDNSPYHPFLFPDLIFFFFLFVPLYCSSSFWTFANNCYAVFVSRPSLGTTEDTVLWAATWPVWWSSASLMAINWPGGHQLVW